MRERTSSLNRLPKISTFTQHCAMIDLTARKVWVGYGSSARSPESTTTIREYGFRARGLRPRPGMTANQTEFPQFAGLSGPNVIRCYSELLGAAAGAGAAEAAGVAAGAGEASGDAKS
jgi:hypothetical protein